MDRIRRTALALLIGAALVWAPGLLRAEDPGRDGIARNLLERRQQELDFGSKLYDSPTRVVPDNGVAPHSVPGSPGRSQLNDTQLRRLLELQQQNKNQDEAVRKQQGQTQQLQFEREDDAQHLQEQIERDSRSSMQQIR